MARAQESAPDMSINRIVEGTSIEGEIRQIRGNNFVSKCRDRGFGKRKNQCSTTTLIERQCKGGGRYFHR